MFILLSDSEETDTSEGSIMHSSELQDTIYRSRRAAAESHPSGALALQYPRVVQPDQAVVVNHVGK